MAEVWVAIQPEHDGDLFRGVFDSAETAKEACDLHQRRWGIVKTLEWSQDVTPTWHGQAGYTYFEVRRYEISSEPVFSD